MEWEEYKEHYLTCEKCPRLAERLIESNRDSGWLFGNISVEITDPLEFLRAMSTRRNRTNDLNDSYVLTVFERVTEKPFLLQEFVTTLSKCLTLRGYLMPAKRNAFERLVSSVTDLIQVVGVEEFLVFIDTEYLDEKELLETEINLADRLIEKLVRWGFDLGLSREEAEEIMNQASSD